MILRDFQNIDLKQQIFPQALCLFLTKTAVCLFLLCCFLLYMIIPSVLFICLLQPFQLLQQLFYDANICGAEGQVQKEKDVFYEKYLKNGLLLKPVMEEGKMVFKIEIYKK